MEIHTKKSCTHKPEKKKLELKSGKVGAIGAAITLGGALATAALIAAFFARPKGRTSSEGRSQQKKNSTPPQLLNEADIGNQSGPTTGLQCILPDSSSNPSGVTSEGESENDSPLFVATRIPILERNAGFDINGGKSDVVDDADDYDQVSCSSTGLHMEPENMMHEIRIGLDESSIVDEISKKIDVSKQVYVEKEEGLAGEPSDDFESSEMNIIKTGDGEKTQGNSSIDNPLISHEAYSVAKVDAENMKVSEHLEEHVTLAPLPFAGHRKEAGEDDVQGNVDMGVEMLLENSDSLSKTSEYEDEADGEEYLCEVEASSLGTEGLSVELEEEETSDRRHEYEEPFVKAADQVMVMDREVGGKMKEDRLLTKGTANFFTSERYEKAFNGKYVALKDHLTNSRRGKILVWTLLVGPLLWYCGMQFVGVCLVAFFTVVFSGMCGVMGTAAGGYISRKSSSGATTTAVAGHQRRQA